MNIDFNKGNGLVPVIIQNSSSLQVLMLGYMNKEAYAKTVAEGIVTFFSRSKNRLWTKGETSGHNLRVKNVHIDCDQDTILIQVFPKGPVCHEGTISCFKSDNRNLFLYALESTINQRILDGEEMSYTYRLFQKGINKVAQKVGEEAVELIIEAKDDDLDLFKNEAADLLFHYLILLRTKGVSLSDIEDVLKERNQ